MKPEKIVMHHSATIDGATASWGAIRDYHIHNKGWLDIGYHFGVERIDDGAGRRHIEVLMGRMPSEIGGHTVGENHRSLGVCIVGNFDLAPPPADVWQRAAELVAWLCFNWKLEVQDVYGHRDFAHKTCPGNLFDMGAFHDAVAAELAKVKP